MQELLEMRHGFYKYDVNFISMGDMGIQRLAYEIEDLVRRADIIYFDYGGLFYYAYETVQSYHRLIIPLIERYRSKTWVCTSTQSIFEGDDILKLEECGVTFTFN